MSETSEVRNILSTVAAVMILVKGEEREEGHYQDQEGGILAAENVGSRGDRVERRREKKREKRIEKIALQIVDGTVMTGTTPLPSALGQKTERRKINGQNPVGDLRENELVEQLDAHFVHLYGA